MTTRSINIRRRDIIERVGLGLVVVVLDDEIDFGDLEAGDRQVELRRDFEQSFELDGEDFRVPAGLLCQPVVGNDVGPLLGLGHVRQADRRHVGQPKQLRRFDATVAGEDDEVFVDEDRIVEAERRDAVGDLPDLPARMRARIAWVRLEGRERTDDNFEVVKRPAAA